jgi:hypothetical protein
MKSQATRRAFLSGALAFSVMPLTYGPARAKTIKTDPQTGRKYFEEMYFVPTGTGGLKGMKIRRYVIERISFEEEPIVGRKSGIGLDKPVSEVPIASGPVTNQREYEDAVANAQAEDPDLNVDPDNSYGSYQFGSAGSSAAVQAFGYGILASASGLGERLEQIQALKGEINDLENALNVQIANHQSAEIAIGESLATRQASFEGLLASVSELPKISVPEPLSAVADGDHLFATSDPFLAMRLARMGTSINTETVPSALRDIGYASIRQADVENAVGDGEISASLVSISRTIADVAIGIDPITGTVRSAYELFTGNNLITGEQLTDVERGLALVNLAMIGGFSSFERAAVGISKVAKILGGTKGLAVIETVSQVANKWPTKTINKMLGWRTAGEAVVQDARIGLSSKAIVPIGATDGWYARVMEETWANEVVKGGTLSSDSVAFITERQAIGGISSRSEMARRLSLLDKSNPAAFQDLSKHVVVEFRFVTDEPLAYIASPFGELGRYGPGFIPGGYTAGGVREWLVDSSAMSKGMIDPSSIAVRKLTGP